MAGEYRFDGGNALLAEKCQPHSATATSQSEHSPANVFLRAYVPPLIPYCSRRMISWNVFHRQTCTETPRAWRICIFSRAAHASGSIGLPAAKPCPCLSLLDYARSLSLYLSIERTSCKRKRGTETTRESDLAYFMVICSRWTLYFSFQMLHVEIRISRIFLPCYIFLIWTISCFIPLFHHTIRYRDFSRRKVGLRV